MVSVFTNPAETQNEATATRLSTNNEGEFVCLPSLSAHTLFGLGPVRFSSKVVSDHRIRETRGARQGTRSILYAALGQECAFLINELTGSKARG